MDIKLKKASRVVIAGACAAALAIGTAIPAFAQDVKLNTNVSYNTAQSGTTDNITWQVFIPSNLSFTDATVAKNGVGFQVRLASKTGIGLDQLTDIPTGGVQVYVKSQNVMTLKINKLDGQPETGSAADPLEYNLKLNPVKPDAGHTPYTVDKSSDFNTVPLGAQVAKLDATNDTYNGMAAVTTIPQKDGDHRDMLTFGFSDGQGGAA